MRAARFRLACLWLSQVARFTADNCLRVFLVLVLVDTGTRGQSAAWHLVTAILMTPAVVLAPINGALCNALPRRWVLAGSAAYCLAVTALLALLNGFWLAGWALLAIGEAVYSPARYALLPAAADDTGIPLTRVNGWIETGFTGAVVGGWILGGALSGWSWFGLEATAVAATALSVIGLVAALPVWFPSDVHRREAPARALAGFFHDCGRIFRDREALGSLLGLGGLQSILLATIGAFIAILGGGDYPLHELLTLGLWIAGGLAVGSLLAGVQRHQRRALGLVPLGATGLFVGLLVAALTGGAPPGWACAALGLAAGLADVPLAAKYQAIVPADARGNAMAVRNTIEYLFIAVLAGLMAGLAYLGVLPGGRQLWLLAGLAALGTAVAWGVLIRNFLELLLEWLIWPLHRIRGHGPGLVHFPPRGPVLVVANHTAWFDPVWLGKVLPRQLTPMMTSVFYDLPVLRWLMQRVVGAIRVPFGKFRREAPELAEAIRVLDNGGCVVLFPEGSLRRSEDRVLRPFGQGAWHILRERPQTPVVVCWIEGGWGSYWSYRGGPPTKHKRLDFWRRIDVAVAEPQLLKAEMLANHRTTRTYLFQQCLEARRYLGLPPLGAAPEDAADDNGRAAPPDPSAAEDGAARP